jgi:hypothetical protein
MLEIKCPLTGKRIAVAENDFENKMYFNQAVNSCNNLGIGWRLPKQYELDLIYNQLHKLGKGNFKKTSY